MVQSCFYWCSSEAFLTFFSFHWLSFPSHINLLLIFRVVSSLLPTSGVVFFFCTHWKSCFLAVVFLQETPCHHLFTLFFSSPFRCMLWVRTKPVPRLRVTISLQVPVDVTVFTWTERGRPNCLTISCSSLFVHFSLQDCGRFLPQQHFLPIFLPPNLLGCFGLHHPASFISFEGKAPLLPHVFAPRLGGGSFLEKWAWGALRLMAICICSKPPPPLHFCFEIVNRVSGR